MGTGGGDSGGGGGGFGGGGGGSGRFGSLQGVGDDAAKKLALQQKLNKFAKSQLRGPASSEAGGPMDDLWSVINKAYKKNSGTMFHNQE